MNFNAFQCFSLNFRGLSEPDPQREGLRCMQAHRSSLRARPFEEHWEQSLPEASGLQRGIEHLRHFTQRRVKKRFWE